MESNRENKSINNQEVMTNKDISISKKVWKIPTVELISVASGAVSRGVEGGSTFDHNFTPARFASKYHS